jgi:hypothetical protein
VYSKTRELSVWNFVSTCVTTGDETVSELAAVILYFRLILMSVVVELISIKFHSRAHVNYFKDGGVLYIYVPVLLEPYYSFLSGRARPFVHP